MTNILPLGAPSTSEILTGVRNTIKRVEKYKKEGEALRRLIMPRRGLAKLGNIPRKVYATGTIIVHQGPISKLPNEIMHLVVSHLDKVWDRTSFALTCKSHAALVEGLKARDEAKAKKGNKRKAGISREHRLQVLIRVRDMMPAHLRLCYGCLVYLPKDDEGWRINTAIMQRKLASKKALIEGSRCPTCVKKSNFELVKDKEQAKKLEKMLHEICK